jgi:hypothetical protein
VGRLAVLGQAGRNCFGNNPPKKAVFFIQSLVLGLFPPGGRRRGRGRSNAARSFFPYMVDSGLRPANIERYDFRHNLTLFIPYIFGISF